jgi:prepilin-type processing-associated H-X9-DG protein
MKTRLMLEGQRVERLFIDGPSLVIGMKATALSRLPLRRLRSVMVVGTLTDGFAALLHCAEKQIPILFCDGHSKIKTQILPYQKADFA